MLQGGLMHFRLTALFMLMVALTTASVHAQNRIALLIGNEAYKREVGPLSNPINDVNLIAASLRKIGFAKNNIRIVKNGTRRQVLRAIERHTRRLAQAGDGALGFLYYSGHGIANQADRRNYLIPVDVERFDADVWFDAVPLDEIVTKLSRRAPKAANFVVFDACRNLLNAPTKGGKGFVPVQTRRGMLIAFSTDPGKTASDEGQGSGPYAKALAQELAKPGVDHLDLFQNVKERVYRATQVQVPWTRDGMLERVYLGGKKKEPAKPPRPTFSQQAELEFWNAAKASNDPAYVRAYLEQYPAGNFAPLARLLAKRLEDKREEQSLARIRQEKLRVERERQLQTELERERAARIAAEAARLQEQAKRPSEEARKLSVAALTDSKASVEKRETESVTPQRAGEESPNPLDLAKRVQAELKRVGCLAGSVDGLWGKGSKRALSDFNKYVKLRLATAIPTSDALAAIEQKRSRVCPNREVTGTNPAKKKPTGAGKSSKPKRKTASKRCRQETLVECIGRVRGTVSGNRVDYCSTNRKTICK